MRRGLSTKLIRSLVEDEVIAEDAVDMAQEIHQQKGGKIEDILVEQGFVDEDDMLSYRALVLETVPIHLDSLTIPIDVLALVPEDMATRHQLIPISRTSAMLTVAMANPLDIRAIDDIEKRTRLRVVPMLSSKEEIEAAVSRSYKSARDTVGDYLKKIQPGEGEGLETVADEADAEMMDVLSLERLAEDAPIVGLVDLLLRQAIQDGASDVHIEIYESALRVRFRVDGVLEEVDSPPKQLHPAIISRIKIMANMDISERRKPQDGRLKIRMSRGNVNLRVSTLPTAYGEKVVMRIADEAKTMFGLDQLGMSSQVLERYVQSIERPYGMILVTGPTGSGKTSTLYASLHRINTPDVNIITVEDPIEYLISGLNQVEINPRAGRTFVAVLRAILRQDPDIVMVGEVRDFETAELAVEASLTGHLVFSTLHTNDAPSAISRLLDLGVESFLISASLSCVMAQRLVRVLCPNCKKPYKPPQELLDQLGLPPGDYTLFEKQGCPICENKGYKGRTGIYEVMFMNEEIRELVSLKKDMKAIQRAAVNDGMKTLRQAAIDTVVEGVTSIEEALRATAEQ